jgi:hypothetical protein
LKFKILTAAYFPLRYGASLARSVPRWEQRRHGARRSADPGGQGGSTRSGQAAHIGSGGGAHGGSSTTNFNSNSIKKYIAVKPCWNQKVEIYSRKRCSWLSEENEQPPGDGGRDGEAGQAAQGGQGDLDRACQPASSGLRQSNTSRVLNLIKKNKILFQRNFPTHHPLIFFLRLREGCIL